MKKINFKNLPSTETPIDADNLNLLQNNIEESTVVVGTEQPTNKQAVWFKSSRNLIDISRMPGVREIAKNTYRIENVDQYINFINIKINAPAVLSYEIKSDNGTNIRFAVTYEDGSTASDLLVSNNSFQKRTFKTEKNITKLSIDYSKQGWAELRNVQITSGSEELPFESYANKEILTFNGNKYDKFNLIESGSNENGSYIKFDDGIMICSGITRLRAIRVRNDNILSGVYQYNIDNVFFPMKFISMPTIVCNNIDNEGSVWISEINCDAEKIKRIIEFNFSNFESLRSGVSYVAIGRWK